MYMYKHCLYVTRVSITYIWQCLLSVNAHYGPFLFKDLVDLDQEGDQVVQAQMEDPAMMAEMDSLDHKVPQDYQVCKD